MRNQVPCIAFLTVLQAKPTLGMRNWGFASAQRNNSGEKLLKILLENIQVLQIWDAEAKNDLLEIQQ